MERKRQFNLIQREKRIKHKTTAPSEDRTHDLQIMRLTRCLLRYRGDDYSKKKNSYSKKPRTVFADPACIPRKC